MTKCFHRILLFLLPYALPLPMVGAERLVLRADMMTNMSGVRPAVELIDEQELAGDPKAGAGGEPKTAYSNGFINANLHYPLAVVFDLGSEHALSDVWYFDVPSSGSTGSSTIPSRSSRSAGTFGSITTGSGTRGTTIRTTRDIRRTSWPGARAG